MLPFEAPCKVFLIHEADRMLPTSMNALLKTLEEPVSRSITILTSSRPQALLPTITSRCFSIPFFLLTQEELIAHLKPEKTPDEARRIALLSRGSLERAEAPSKKGESLCALVFDLGLALLYREYPPLKEYDDVEDSEEVLLCLFYFYRDLSLLKVGGDPSLLFYRDREETLKKALASTLPSLESIGKKMEEIHRAREVNIPLSHSLPSYLINNFIIDIKD